MLRRALFDADVRGRLIVLDLRGVSFCDSSGLQLLIRADMRARDDGRRLVIVPGAEQVRRMFALTGVDRILEIVEDASKLIDAERELASSHP